MKRYDMMWGTENGKTFCTHEEFPNGLWVLYEDVESLSAEVKNANAAFEESDTACAELEDENERLVDRVDLLEGVVRACHLAFVKIPNLVSEDQALADTVKERIADPKIVDVDVEDLVSTEQAPVCPNTATEKDCTQIGNTQEPDVNVCPGCGGYADNGFSRSVPPDPYYCTKCEPVGDRQEQKDG